MEINTENIIFAIIALILLIVTVVFSGILIFAKKEKRKEMKKIKIAAVISALIAAFMISEVIVYYSIDRGEGITPFLERLPSLIGRSYEECKEEYSDKFELIVQEELYSSEYPEGTIIEQTPIGGSEYLAGDTTVYCFVSRGKKPDVTEDN